MVTYAKTSATILLPPTKNSLSEICHRLLEQRQMSENSAEATTSMTVSFEMS